MNQVPFRVIINTGKTGWKTDQSVLGLRSKELIISCSLTESHV